MAQKAYSRVLSDYEHADDFLRKSLHLNNEFSTKQFNDADRKSTRLNSSHWNKSRMPSSA